MQLWASRATFQQGFVLPLSSSGSRNFEQGAEGQGVESREGAMPLPKNVLKFYAKIVHFRAKFSPVLRCFRSMGAPS